MVSVAPPSLRNGMLLIKNYFSVISAGTEKTTIDSRKSSLLQRAKSQPEEVQKVVEEARRTGLSATYKRIMSKLDSAAALGYSSAGIVLAVDEWIDDIEVGDRVACAGAEYANHSDVIVAPRNLVARVPEGVSTESAAYTTIAAIAMQGVRQAEPTLGETVAVIGLGLLGQFTVQLLRANGCPVIGVDMDPFALNLARTSGADLVLHRSDDDVESAVRAVTRGHGADAVIITAGAKDNDPIVLAGNITRERGRVVVVGATPMNIPREPYYRKEIDIRLSRSYGPGRYDARYERDGLDYPIGYVRWTENRNMLACLELMRKGDLSTDLITTHRFTVDRALDAYALIEGERSQPYVGIVLSYDDLHDDELKLITSSQPLPAGRITISPKRESLTIGFIGAGNFASGYLLPHLKEIHGVTLDTVCNRSGLTSADMRNKFGFRADTTNPDDIFASERIGTVFISTRHGDHARLTLKALSRGQHVFVEKPLALNEEELSSIESILAENPDLKGRLLLMTGFNRRFAPLVLKMKEFFPPSAEPCIINYYVNAGFLPKDHWTQDPLEGGGRIIGEVCHFIDTAQYLTDSNPERIFAERIRSDSDTAASSDNISITLRMGDGSIATIIYASNGDSSFPKERIIMSRGRATAHMNNFTTLEMYGSGKRTVVKSPGDKGHRNEVGAFIDAIKSKLPAVIPFESMAATTRATFGIVESLRTRGIIDVA